MQRAAEVAPRPPRPVLTPEGFLALCRMPPLQVGGPQLCATGAAGWLLCCSRAAASQLTNCCSLCPPLPAPARPAQGPKVRLHKPTFAPLLPEELPQPGSLFALDAEFVAYSPPEKALLRCAPAPFALCAAAAPCCVGLWRDAPGVAARAVRAALAAARQRLSRAGPQGTLCAWARTGLRLGCRDPGLLRSSEQGRTLPEQQCSPSLLST